MEGGAGSGILLSRKSNEIAPYMENPMCGCHEVARYCDFNVDENRENDPVHLCP